MGWVNNLTKSSLGAKYVMAITGILLLLFLVGHVAGNLLVFLGQDALNAYAQGLRELPFGLLWVARIGLVAIFALHLFTAINLTQRNKAARPISYAYNSTLQASYASRTMIISGLLIFLYVAFHLSHFTFGWVGPGMGLLDDAGRPDVYGMVIAGFSQPLFALTYIIAMGIMGYHLSHGLASVVQTLGVTNHKAGNALKGLGPIVGWLISLAFAVIPLSIWVGILK